MSLDPLRNPQDPLRKSGPDQGQELFRQFSKLASGFSTADVVCAAVNVLINAVRQAHPNRTAAEARFNELFGTSKDTLLGHYDGVTGKRRNIFPFHQFVHAELFEDKDK
jgi:hypothetical protein